MSDLAAPPVLSTPSEHILEEPDPPSPKASDSRTAKSNRELRDVYEVERTAKEIQEGGWSRVALQFPDSMLHDAPRVVEALSKALYEESAEEDGPKNEKDPVSGKKPAKLYVLADTAYSACCVDEIAAEHVNADVVIHYGRSCLSPTQRLPVIYVFTRYPLDHDAVAKDFEAKFPDKTSGIILMADVTYQDHIPSLTTRLRNDGYTNLLSTSVIHDPSGTIPNRKLEAASPTDALSTDLRSYAAYQISSPPTSLLLALHSRLADLHIFPTSAPASETPSTAALLRRRFARVLSLASAGTIGILINTLSVANYLDSIEVLKRRIARAGKKSYTVVVGKLNPAKLANFAEVEGWVVVGCWESGLVEDEKSFFRPVVTPFEMGVALLGEEERTWGGEWWGGIEGLRIGDEEGKETEREKEMEKVEDGEREAVGEVEGGVEGEESAPPEFDLRTGRLVSSRPMRALQTASSASTQPSGGDRIGDSASAALIKRQAGELATVNGVVSPGAEFLRSQRTWQGLGSDFTANDESAVVEEGRSGVARGYVVGDDESRR